MYALHNAKVASWQDSGGSSIPHMTPEMFSAYRSGMPKHWDEAAIIKWSNDWSGVKWLEIELWFHLHRRARRERWKFKKGEEYFRRLAGLAIAELGDPTHWKTKQSRAYFMGIKPQNWNRDIEQHYQAAYEMVDQWAASAYEYINKRQRA